METTPSQALLAAQERLLALRQQVQSSLNQPQLLVAPALRLPLTSWPAHLGWHSQPLSQLLVPTEKVKPAWGKNLFDSSPVSPPLLPTPLHPYPSTLTLSPDLALTLLHHNRVTESRIWFLLRYLDETGRGWVDLGEVRRCLSEETSLWCICGWRQLRILLGQGDGLFWERQGGRLWLRSVVKVAAALGLTRLSGHPVALPIHILTRPIGEVKAHFYASFHSGRNHDHQPIARTTLSHLSGVSPQTQRSYEKRARVRPQRNFALGEVATHENKEERTWQQGTAVFTFTDFHGKQGPAQTTYIAWQLPNDYTGPHDRQPKRRHKRLNRQLADLRQQGTAGNNQYQKRFFANGCDAVKGQKGREVIWRGRGRTFGGQIWHLLSKPDTQLVDW